MEPRYDIAIVGAGITGCAIARQLARYDKTICLIEATDDIALGASKANGGLIHAGYDPAPGTMKAKMNARGCELYGTWSKELGFLFQRTGSLVLGFTDEDLATLEHLRDNGLANGVPTSRSSAPIASPNWNRAPIRTPPAPYGAPPPAMSTRSRLPSPQPRTP